MIDKIINYDIINTGGEIMNLVAEKEKLHKQEREIRKQVIRILNTIPNSKQNKKFMIVNSKELKNCWCPSYFIISDQVKMLKKIVIKSQTISSMINEFKYIVEHKRDRKNVTWFNEKVIEFIKENIL